MNTKDTNPKNETQETVGAVPLGNLIATDAIERCVRIEG